jgi:hypothetical protein
VKVVNENGASLTKKVVVK